MPPRRGVRPDVLFGRSLEDPAIGGELIGLSSGDRRSLDDTPLRDRIDAGPDLHQGFISLVPRFDELHVGERAKAELVPLAVETETKEPAARSILALVEIQADRGLGAIGSRGGPPPARCWLEICFDLPACPSLLGDRNPLALAIRRSAIFAIWSTASPDAPSFSSISATKVSIVILSMSVILISRARASPAKAAGVLADCAVRLLARGKEVPLRSARYPPTMARY